jgi:ribosomal protein S13
VNDAAEETRHFHKTMAEKTHRHILANVRRLLPRNKQPNWALAMEVFGVGSTYGYWICKEAGIDPDAKTLTAFAQPEHQ